MGKFSIVFKKSESFILYQLITKKSRKKNILQNLLEVISNVRDLYSIIVIILRKCIKCLLIAVKLHSTCSLYLWNFVA